MRRRIDIIPFSKKYVLAHHFGHSWYWNSFKRTGKFNGSLSMIGVLIDDMWCKPPRTYHYSKEYILKEVRKA